MMYTSWADLMYSHGLRMWSVHTCLENTRCSHGRILEALTKYGNLASPTRWIINPFCFQPYTPIHRPGQLSRYSDSLLAGRLGDRIPVGGENFRTRPDRPWGQPSPYTMGTESLPGIKPGRGVDQPPPRSDEVKEGVKLYLYCSSVPSWQVAECTIPVCSTIRV